MFDNFINSLHLPIALEMANSGEPLFNFEVLVELFHFLTVKLFPNIRDELVCRAEHLVQLMEYRTKINEIIRFGTESK